MNKICLPAHFVLIILLLLPFIGTAQPNTIDSLQRLLDKAKHDTTRADLLRIMGFAYRFRDFEKAEEYLEQSITTAQKMNDTLRMAQAEAELALYFFQGRAIHHQALDHFQQGLQLLQKRKDSISLSLRNYIFWNKTLLIHNTVSTTYNMNLANRELFYSARNDLKKVISVLDKNRYWIEIANTYFFFASVGNVTRTPDEVWADSKFGLQSLYDMEEVYRKANYREGVGIAEAHLARCIHFMGIGSMPGFEQGKPIDKSAKKPSLPSDYYPFDWKTCFKVGEAYYRSALRILTETGNTQRQGVVHNGMAYTCLDRNQYDSALMHYKKAHALAYQMNDTRELLHYAQTPQDIYLAKGDYKTACLYYFSYMFFLDSLNQTNSEQNIAALEKSYAIKLKESEIGKLQTDAAYLATQQRQQTILFVSGLSFLLIVCGLALYAYYQRRKSSAQLEKNLELQSLLQLNLESALNDAQLTAARAQMNPHFVFNSINAIQNLILKENKNDAISYLNDFSKLTRETLENSNKETITLKEEISFLEHYLQLESLRSTNPFEYDISCAEDIDTGYERIPPMMLQPFIENAIKHGFPSSPKKNHLAITFEIIEESLRCTIEDNGIGRTASAKLKNGNHHSMATEITNARLELLHEKANLKHKYKVRIEDLHDESGAAAGTKVILSIPIESTVTA